MPPGWPKSPGSDVRLRRAIAGMLLSEPGRWRGRRATVFGPPVASPPVAKRWRYRCCAVGTGPEAGAGLGLLEHGHDPAILATFFNSPFKEGISPLGRAVIIRDCRSRYTMTRNSTHDSTHSCRLQLPNPRLEPGTLSTYGARGDLFKQGDPRCFGGVS